MAVEFDLESFLPYLLNQAAEAASLGFQQIYRADHAMTRTQWRVMAHLGKGGALTAGQICAASQMEKTKVSRAVLALEQKGFLRRAVVAGDRRAESLRLTEAGRSVFGRLGAKAVAYDAALRERLGPGVQALEPALRALIAGKP